MLTGTCEYLLAGIRLFLCGCKNCSVFLASTNAGNKFSYSSGSASELAALLLTLPKFSLHNCTTLKSSVSFIKNRQKGKKSNIHVKNPPIWQYNFTRGCFLYLKRPQSDLCITGFAQKFFNRMSEKWGFRQSSWSYVR